MWISLSLAFLLALATHAQDGGAASSRQSEEEFARGVGLQQKGDLQGAREAYEASLRSMPRRADALTNLGVGST
jgi:Flp pilus assembly protein TadD